MRKYDSDVFYEVWRSGGNPDLIDPDRVDDSEARGYDADAAAQRELWAQSRRRYHEEIEDEG